MGLKTLYQIIDLLKSGLTKSLVQEIILNSEDNKFVAEYISELIIEASKEISEQYVTKNDQLIGLHLGRYNRKIKELFNKDFSSYDLAIQRKIKSAVFLDLLETLHQKEKLLQLHSKQTIVRFNQRNSININEIASKFNLEQLDHEEKVRLLELLLKTKLKDGEDTVSVILNKKETSITDILFEEIGETPTNVNLSKVEQIINIEEQVIEKKYTSLEDIKRKLSQALEKVAREELIKAGSKTVRNESRDM